MQSWRSVLIGAWLCMLTGALGIDASGQAFPIFNGSSNTCAGAFLDSGGEGASGYSNNEDYTYTICPDTPGGAISLSFITFNLSTAGAAPVDAMTIYDGSSTAAPLLGTWTGTTLQGQVVSASGGNPTGCLTVVFRSNNAGTGVFAATITCYQPCSRPIAAATYGSVDPLKICPGEPVNFNSAASQAAPGFSIASRQWIFGDGTMLNNAPVSVNHTYAQPGGYTAQLYLVDNNGCASTNRVDLLTLVGTAPNFNGTEGITGCSGETLCLDGVVNPTTWNELPGNDLGSGVFLPDNVGSCFTTSLTYSQFAPGQTLTNVNQLIDICVSMEHSFMGDLVISIISPTGETVVMHQQGGGGTFLGIPVDNDLTPNVQGTCWEYCWSPTATNGTWVDNATGTLPSGTYESLNPLSGLLGSQLNGTWTFQVCDLWGSDNGFICDWGMDFAPSLYPDLLEFTPVYGAGCDSSSWAGPNITTTTNGCNHICAAGLAPGDHPYVYTVADNFGCTYDTTVMVTIVPDLQVDAGPDASTCGTPVQLAATTSGGLPTDCTYVLWLYDDFGDGWTNNSYVTVSIDGVSTDWTLPGGTGGSTTITVSQGSTIALAYFGAGLFAFEQSFELFDSDGVSVFSASDPPNGIVWIGTANCHSSEMVYSWSPTAGLSDAAIANPIATVASTTQYCVTVYQAGHPDCTATDCVTITVDDPVDAGTDGAITLCAVDAAFSLFSELGGTPVAGGTWAAPGGAAHGDTFTPGTDPGGIYTYTVNGTGACGSSSSTSTVTVTINTPPNAGTDGSITLCSSDAAASLFAQLGGTPDAGGTWSGPSAVAGGMIDPATMSAGAYIYTVTGTAPCPVETATVNVTINTPPDPGTDGSITLCSSDAAANLFNALGGTPDAVGTWTGPSAVVGGMIDPATMSAGAYIYTVSGTAPCPDESATVTVTINTPPDAGTDGAITLCSSDAAASLFAQLGGTPDAGGTWTGPSAVAGGMIDPATMSAGAYIYTVTGTAPCPVETATVNVTINTPPDPGTDGAITLCSSDAAASLFAQLGGTPDAGGTWTGPSTVTGGMIDPATMSAGAYIYTVSGTAPCPDESATVTVMINTPPDAGTDGVITLCSSDAAASLFAQLGGTPDAGGTWSGPSAVAGGMIDPATMSAGAYIYTVTGTAPCPVETATVNVTINTPPDPGTDGSITLCSSDAAANLFNALGGTPDAGGTWTGPSAVVGGMIDPATMSAGAYIYTVSGTAPCPDESATVTVTINTPPDAGTDGAITLCSSDAAASLFAQLGGTPDAGGTWTGPSAVAGGMIDPATMSAGAYIYTVTGTAPCPVETATVNVTINAPPDPGTDGAITLCSSDAAASLFARLGGTPDTGGTWTGPSTVTGGMIDPATMSAGAYTYTVAGTAPCPDESATVTVMINTPPNAGTDGSITLCSSDAAASLFAQLGGTPDAGGTWSGPSAVAGGMIDPATMSAGTYIYTVTGTAPCPVETATVNVTINTPPDPGTDGAITLCSSDAAASLFAQLGGTPDAGGTWTGPSTVTGGMIDPATMSAGAYVYTVSGTAPCSDESATVTVTINTPPDAGTDGAITLCSSDAAASLFAQLGGTPDAGGTWSGPSAVAGGMIDPATMSAGAYIYTVTGTAPCPVETATVNVTINTQPDAGTDGSIALCISSPAIALFPELNGSPDAGGTWSGPSPVVAGQFDPATMAIGDYTYTVTGTAPCPSSNAVVTVNVVTNPDPGTPTTLTRCASDASFDLFDELGGTPDPGGSWTGPSVVVGGQFDPATMFAGVYTYTIAVPPPCSSVSSTVTINLVQPADAGDNSALTLCISSPATDLFAVLGGSPDAGGTWTGPSAITGGSFDPATMSAGDYTYTVAGTSPCPADAAIVSVSVVSAPDAGTPGSITLCSSDAAIDLFALLGGTPDAGGTWNGPSTVTGGQFDPANMSAGVYTYTISVPPPCVDATSTVTVAVQAPPDAGIDGSLTLCISSPAADLFTVLGGSPDAGGTWTGPSAITGGSFDPATMSAGDYTYTVAGVSPCPADQATVSVSVVATPDAGSPGNITLCASDAAIDLFEQLGGTPDAGGAWSGPSTVTGGQFDPANMSAGVYTYTISVPPPCVDATSTVTVAVQAPPDAGIDGSLTLCISSPATSLFTSLGGSPDAGGTWTGPSEITGGSFDPATMSAGDYTYTVAGVSPCPADQATVSVSVVATPDAGSPGNITLCASDAAIDLFEQLGGTPDAGGAWSGPSTVTGGTFNPATMSAGVYTYTISVPPPCVNVSSTVTVAVQAPPDAGNDGSLTLCISSPATSLFTSLGGSPDAGGTWTGPSAITGGSFDPATMSAGDYTYTVAGVSPCPADQATVSVSVVATPDAGSPGNITLCASDAAIDLFEQLGGTPDAGGAWSGPSTVTGGTFNPATMSAGEYTYTITVPPPCVNVSSTVTVAVQAPPDAGIDGSLTLCISSPATSLFTSLGGSPDAGGTWTGPSAITGGSFDPATMSAGDYTYTVAGTTPCPADAATVSVNVLAAPDAGSPGNITLCASDAAIDLFDQLGGTPDAGGAWSGPSTVTGGTFNPATMSAGEYTYTISVPPPCMNVSSTVTVAVQAPPNAGNDGSLTLCISSPATDLFAVLGGNPDTGGTWTGPSAISAGSFDPATMNAGDYTYTVAGTSPCPAAAAVVSVSVATEPDPGEDDILNLCASGSPLELFPVLGGADPGGSWTGPSGASFNGTFIPGTSAPGNYTYTIVGVAPCPSVSAVIAVNVVTDADAGDDGSIALCSSADATDLFTLLQGSPDTGGDWLAPDGTAFSGTFDALANVPGSYTYVINVPFPCVNDTAHVLVDVTPAVNAGTDSSITLCSSNPPIDLLGQLGGSPDEGGSWSGPGGTSSQAFYPSSGTPGNYTYTVQGTAPCPNATATVTIALNRMPDAGTDGTITVCPEAAAVDLFALLGGTPDQGGTWTAPGGAAHGNQFDPATDPQGAYTYTVFGTAPCPNDNSTSTVHIFLVPAPDAGNDAVSCTLGDALNATGIWSTGHWTGPAGTAITDPDSASSAVSANAGGAYAFIWNTVSAEGCANSDTVTVTFTDAITPSVTVTETLCHGSCDGTASATAVGGNVDSTGYSFQWSAGNGGNSSTGTGFCAGSFSVTVLDTNGCAATTNFTIIEPEPLEIDQITTTDGLCPGSCDGTILIIDPEGTQFSMGSTGTFQNASLFTGICPGSYAVTMLNANGCSATGTAIVGSPEPVRAGFSVHPDTLFINDPTAAFTNTSSANATHFFWNFGDGETSTAINPEHEFPMGIAEVYEVCLTAMTDNGCPDTYCVPLPILELPSIFVPNAFTPDGDGRNDVFSVQGNGIIARGFSFMIFNRWGEKIFDTTDPAASWDGKQNGSVVKEDVYVWKVTAFFFNSIEPVEATGHVTLLK